MKCNKAGGSVMSKMILNEILSEIYVKVRQIIGDDIAEIILYGSYARGDFDNESDIDIAVIVDRNRLDLKKDRKELVSLMSDLSIKYEVVISITCIPLSDFTEYKEALPYYRNIDSEGVRIVA